jgi:hypothetical protein
MHHQISRLSSPVARQPGFGHSASAAALALAATAALLVASPHAEATPNVTRTQAQPARTEKPAEPARKAAPARSSVRTAAGQPPRHSNAPSPTLPPAGGEQLAAAALAHFGEHACEFNQTVQVSLNLEHPGYLDVLFGNQFYLMKPVLSSTGALRLEDVGGRMLLLQIAFKSMLMDTRSGRRLADECVHEAHQIAKREAERAPARPGLGIAPAGAAASAATSG